MEDYYWDDFDCEIQCEEAYYDDFVYEYDPVEDINLPF